MYFLYGWPKTFRLPEGGEKLRRILFSPDQKFVAGLTKSGVFIWSGDQHRALLGYFKRPHDSVAATGRNECLFWTSDSSFIISTHMSYIYNFTLEELMNEEIFNAGVPEGAHLFSLGTKYRQLVKLDHFNELGRGSIVWILEDRLSAKLVVCTRDGYLQRWHRTAQSALIESLMKLSGTYDPYTRYTYTLEEEIPLCGLPQVRPPADRTPRKKTSLGPAQKPTEIPPSEASVDFEPATPREFTIRSIRVLHKEKIAAFVTFDGRAALLQGDLKEFESLQCLWLPIQESQSFASSIALNLRFHLIAVGLSNGDVEFFNTLQHHRYERTLSLQPWAITEKVTGFASVLDWSSDGRALAVGYAERGMSLWSLSGCRLACTIIQSTVLSGVKKQTMSREAAADGVEALVWSAEGYSLLFCGPQKPGLLEEFSLVKTSLANNPNLNYCQRIVLQGSDRLHVLHQIDPNFRQAYSDGEHQWMHLLVPPNYIVDNWPIRLVSVSHDAVLAAVCGKNGFCFANLQKNSWKLFGDRNQESQLNILGLCWFKHVLIATNLTQQNTYELLFMPSWSKLSFSSLLLRTPLPHNRKPLYVDCNDSFLVLFTTDSFFFQYKILCEYSSENPTEITKISLRLVQQVSVGRAATSPSSVLLLPAWVTIPHGIDNDSAFSKVSMAAAKCVVLNSNGDLSLQNAEKSINVTLAQTVEQFWMANPAVGVIDQDLSNTLWAYGQFGLNVWFPFFQPTTMGVSAGPHTSVTPLTFLSRDRSLEFDLEVYPIGFLPDEAIVVGVSQGYSFPSASFAQKGPVFDLQTKSHPFLHSILRQILEKGADGVDAAYTLARKYRHVPHYSHSVELLLHEVLEDEYQLVGKALKASRNDESVPASPSFDPPPHSTPPVGAGLTLKRVIELLKRLGGLLYAPLVVACARKTDPALWALLFHPVYGAQEPQILFSMCLESGDVRSAASYLRVLQLHYGDSTAKRAGVQVVNLCLKNGDWALLKDLLRFLEPDVSETTSSSSGSTELPVQADTRPLSRSSSSSDVIEPTISEDEEYLLERSLAVYASDLLRANKLRELARFARFCHRPARYWFMRERKRAAVVQDFDGTLNSLHEQFRIPHPAYAPINLLVQIQRSGSSSTLDALSVSDDEDASSGSLERTRFMEYNAIYYPGSDFLLRKPRSSVSHESMAEDSDEPQNPLQSPRFPDMESAMQASFMEIEYLLGEFIAAGCVGWTLLCATVLFRIRVIVHFLRKYPEFKKVYLPLLAKQGESYKGYRDLLSHLDSVLHAEQSHAS